MTETSKRVITSETHQLHEARDAGHFRELMKRHCGLELEKMVGQFADLAMVRATVLGGSIPLRTATGGSDVDILVVVDSSEALKGDLSSSDVLFAFEHLRRDAEPLLANYGILANGVQIDLMFVGWPGLKALIARAQGPRASLDMEEIRLLSRLKTGWDLVPPRADFAAELKSFRADRSVELHCIVRYLRNALKDLEHARLALADNLLQSAYLARAAVVQCFSARFASAGYAVLSSKWLRFLARRPETLSEDPARSEQLARAGTGLLFPPMPGTREEAETYVRRAAEFFNLVRGEIERDLAAKIAISRCRQIYDPLDPRVRPEAKKGR